MLLLWQAPERNHMAYAANGQNGMAGGEEPGSVTCQGGVNERVGYWWKPSFNAKV